MRSRNTHAIAYGETPRMECVKSSVSVHRAL